MPTKTPSPPSCENGVAIVELRAAFTVLELLVVVTVIVMLLALLAPSLDRAVTQAARVRCLANLHGIGIGLGLYLQDSKQKLPSVADWFLVFGKEGIQEPTPVTARPLNIYLGYTADGADVPIAKCLDDRGDSNLANGNGRDHDYTAFGTSYVCAWRNWSGIKGVFQVPPRLVNLNPLHSKILFFDITLLGNRRYAFWKNRWHEYEEDGLDPATAVRRKNVLFGDLHGEFFAIDNALIDEDVNPLNATQTPDPSRGWW